MALFVKFNINRCVISPNYALIMINTIIFLSDSG